MERNLFKLGNLQKIRGRYYVKTISLTREVQV